MAGRIRARRFNRVFMGERSADILVRIADLRAEETQRQGRERPIPWEEALDRLATACGLPRPPFWQRLLAPGSD